MKDFQFNTEQLLPIDINSAWEFFSSPVNLATITPKEMDFKILASLNYPIYEGMIIDYTVKPLLHIPLHWQTKILNVENLVSFTDIQLKGPFKLWEHTHHFIQFENGIMIKDNVRYQLPLGILGNLAHALLIKQKIKDIFIYRKQVLEELFPPRF